MTRRRLVVALFILAAVCGGCGGAVIPDDENIVSAHISRISSRFYIFYNYATIPLRASSFCRDTGGLFADLNYLNQSGGFTNDVSQDKIRFFANSSSHNEYVWTSGKCCEQGCMDEAFENAHPDAFEEDNRVYMPSPGDGCVYSAFGLVSRKLTYLPHDSQRAPEFACLYKLEDLASCLGQGGQPQVDRLRDSRGMCVHVGCHAAKTSASG